MGQHNTWLLPNQRFQIVDFFHAAFWIGMKNFFSARKKFWRKIQNFTLNPVHAACLIVDGYNYIEDFYAYLNIHCIDQMDIDNWLNKSIILKN